MSIFTPETTEVQIDYIATRKLITMLVQKIHGLQHCQI